MQFYLTETHYFSITRNRHLMRFKEIISLYSESNAKQMTAAAETQFLNAKAVRNSTLERDLNGRL